MEYSIVRSNRKTLAIQVGPGGEVTVRAPLRMRETEIKAAVEKNAEWIKKHVEKQLEKSAAHPAPDPAEEQRLRALAKEVIPEKVAYYSGLMGVAPTGIRITGAKTRFGSCSGKNSLSFSFLLIRYPEEAVDYVVVHELAHILHHDHSPAFWAAVEKYMPDYKKRRALLKR